MPVLPAKIRRRSVGRPCARVGSDTPGRSLGRGIWRPGSGGRDATPPIPAPSRLGETGIGGTQWRLAVDIRPAVKSRAWTTASIRKQSKQQRTLILPATVVCGLWWGIALASGDGAGRRTAVKLPPGAVDYLKQVKPLLRERCYACHGPLKQKAGLRLSIYGGVGDQGGDSGSAVKPGDAAGSLLLERVSAIRGIALRHPWE